MKDTDFVIKICLNFHKSTEHPFTITTAGKVSGWKKKAGGKCIERG